MLKLMNLYENFELAKEVLIHWEYDKDTLDKMLSYFRISSNAIYPFCYNGEVRFLRLAPIDEKIEKNILGEIEFIEYLIENKYPALKPIPTLLGAKVLTLDTKWGKYYACAFQKVKGVQIEATDMSKEIMYEYGKTLGRLHALSANFKPNIKKWTHNEVLEWIRQVLEEYGAPMHIFSELNHVKRELSALPLSKDNYGLIHYDFELDNVFYDDKTHSCAVIDFDDGMYHWYALDMEKVFMSLSEELAGEHFEKAMAEFIQGYRTEYCYLEETEKVRFLMRRFIDLYSYARLIRCVSVKGPNEPDWLLKLRRALENKIDTLEIKMKT